MVGLVHVLVPSPLGALAVTASAEGVQRISWLDTPPEGYSPAADAPGDVARLAAAELEAYFAGTLRQFTMPLDLRAMHPFHREVLTTLAREVPWGRTTTYGELARLVGKPGGAQAVGQWMGHNPLPIVLPCHRVLAAGGKMGGFSGGLARKRILLHVEKVLLFP